MPDRKVTFETSPEKFFGALLERVLKNEAHLQAISEHLARLIANVENLDSDDVADEIRTTRDNIYSTLTAEVIAGLTQESADDLLSKIDPSDLKVNPTYTNVNESTSSGS